MARQFRSALLAAVLFAAALAAPTSAGAIRVGQRAGTEEGAVAVYDAGPGWLASLFDAAWSWLTALTDQDNGSIMP